MKITSDIIKNLDWKNIGDGIYLGSFNDINMSITIISGREKYRVRLVYPRGRISDYVDSIDDVLSWFAENIETVICIQSKENFVFELMRAKIEEVLEVK